MSRPGPSGDLRSALTPAAVQRVFEAAGAVGEMAVTVPDSRGWYGAWWAWVSSRCVRGWAGSGVRRWRQRRRGAVRSRPRSVPGRGPGRRLRRTEPQSALVVVLPRGRPPRSAPTALCSSEYLGNKCGTPALRVGSADLRFRTSEGVSGTLLERLDRGTTWEFTQNADRPCTAFPQVRSGLLVGLTGFEPATP